jgi:predicted aspartyl protease
MKKIFLFLMACNLSSCALFQYAKVSKAIQSGSVSQANFKEVVHFKFINNQILIPVEIEGKTYDFLFDTGAPCCISDEMTSTIDLKKVGKNRLVDAQGKKKAGKIYSINQLKIGAISFEKFCYNSLDTRQMTQAYCTSVAGVIGRNLVRHAIWQIDYQQQTITFCDHRDSLNIDKNTQIIPFYGEASPIIHLATDSTYLCEADLDTGSSGSITIPQYNWIKLPQKQKFSKSYGISYAAFSSNIDTSFMTKVDAMTFGNRVELNHIAVSTSKLLTSALIGNKFLKNYLVTIDYRAHELLLLKTQHSDNQLFNYGFFPDFHKDKLVVRSILAKSVAEQKGLKIYDHILQFNGIDTRNMTQEDFCNFQKPTSNEVGLIVLKNGKEEKIVLPK